MLQMIINSWTYIGAMYGFSPAVSIAMGAVSCLIGLSIVGWVVYDEVKYWKNRPATTDDKSI